MESFLGLFLVFVDVFGVVVGDAFDDGFGRDVERGGDGGGTGHVRNDGFSGQEGSGRETRGAKGEIDFGSLFVEFCAVDAEGGGAGGAIS